MKSWRRTLAIGFIIAITSQLYWNVFVNNFRVSASVILLPVLIMTVGSQIHTMTICTVTSIIVFLFRIVIYYLQGSLVNRAVEQFKSNKGCEPSIGELSGYTGVDEEELDRKSVV